MGKSESAGFSKVKKITTWPDGLRLARLLKLSDPRRLDPVLKLISHWLSGFQNAL